jgi:hypothetical protein
MHYIRGFQVYRGLLEATSLGIPKKLSPVFGILAADVRGSWILCE